MTTLPDGKITDRVSTKLGDVWLWACARCKRKFVQAEFLSEAANEILRRHDCKVT